jgi:hypothetical protein
VGTGYYIINERRAILLEPYSHFTFTLIFITRFLNQKTMNKLNLLIVFLNRIYSCSDPAITDDLLDGNIIFDRHYIIPNNSWCLQNTLIPQQQIWINISSLLFMAIRTGVAENLRRLVSSVFFL